MAKAGAVFACCAVLVAGSMPCMAQTFGDLSAVHALRSLTPGIADPEVSKWLMTLPEDERISAAMLDSAPVGGEVYHLTEPSLREARSSTSTGKTEDGIAVWYRLSGRTASGEVADPNAFTAGHRTLPLGTRVRVTNHVNGSSVIVRINDRGPQQRKFVIDMSQASAKAIGLTGTAPVTLAVLPATDAVAANLAPGKQPALEGRSVARPARAATAKPQAPRTSGFRIIGQH
jgi:rare lipoprotein A